MAGRTKLTKNGHAIQNFGDSNQSEIMDELNKSIQNRTLKNITKKSKISRLL